MSAGAGLSTGPTHASLSIYICKEMVREKARDEERREWGRECRPLACRMMYRRECPIRVWFALISVIYNNCIRKSYRCNQTSPWVILKLPVTHFIANKNTSLIINIVHIHILNTHFNIWRCIIYVWIYSIFILFIIFFE